MGSIKKSGEPYDLDVQLGTCVDMYEEDRRIYWSKRQEGGDWGLQQRLLGHGEWLAATLLSGVENLTRPGADLSGAAAFNDELVAFLDQFTIDTSGAQKVILADTTPPDIRKVLEEAVSDIQRRQLNPDFTPSEGSLLKLVWDRLSIQVAREVVDSGLVIRTNRLLQLSRLLVSGTPSASTTRFLQRVSRCYVWGFHPECVILCRGAIDTAFAEAVGDDLCNKHSLPPARYGHTLANRIKAAERESLIDQAIRSAAFRVNAVATKAAHQDPRGDIDVLRIIQDTRDVVEHLSK